MIYGRGTVDMKGAIACFIAAVSRLIKERGGVRGSISLMITGDEEGPSVNGTPKILDWLEDRDERIDACLVGEPSNPHRIGDAIKIGRRGSLTGELIVKGRQGHAAYPHQADNPIPNSQPSLNACRHCASTAVRRTSKTPASQVTIISVPNTASNVIPAEARAIFNVRYNDSWNRATITEHLRNACREIATERDASYSLLFFRHRRRISHQARPPRRFNESRDPGRHGAVCQN